MIYPVNYIAITNAFSNSHRGVDFGWNSKFYGKNQPVYAVDNGIVIYNRKQFKGGYVIQIKHDNGYVSEYGHLKKNTQLVHEGDKVKKGQQIALMGGSGIVTGNHLHFGLYKGSKINYKDKSKFVNPILHLYATPEQIVNQKTLNKYKILKVEDKTYKEGIYKCLYNMNIRKEPKLNSKIVKVKDCTEAMKKALTSKKSDYEAVIKKGTNITILEVIKDGDIYWGKNYSGYICIADSKNQYLESLN